VRAPPARTRRGNKRARASGQRSTPSRTRRSDARCAMGSAHASDPQVRSAWWNATAEARGGKVMLELDTAGAGARPAGKPVPGHAPAGQCAQVMGKRIQAICGRIWATCSYHRSARTRCRVRRRGRGPDFQQLVCVRPSSERRALMSAFASSTCNCVFTPAPATILLLQCRLFVVCLLCSHVQLRVVLHVVLRGTCASPRKRTLTHNKM